MPVDPADLAREYEAGAGLRPLSKKYHIPYAKVRELLVEAGATIRSPNGGTSKEQQISSIERDARVRAVLRMIVVDGAADRQDVYALATDPEGPYRWEVVIETIDGYLSDARALLRDRTAAEIEDLRALLVARLELLWQEAPDTKTKLEVVRERGKLGGAYPATKMEHTGTLTWAELIQSASEGSDD